MKAQALLVKEMKASENLAYTNVICTGKTGTLTCGDMRVKEYMIGNRKLEFILRYDDLESIRRKSSNVAKIVTDCIIMNNDAKIEMVFDTNSQQAIYQPRGNSTEVAMLNFLYENNLKVHDLLSKRQRESEIECTIPFNPIRKSQVSVIREHAGDENVRVVLKGSPEYVLNHCTKFITEEGHNATLDEGMKKQFENTIYGLGPHDAKGPTRNRCFAYAYKDMNSEEWERL